MQLRRAGDRHNPRLLRQQPRERNLSRRYLLPFCDAAKQIDERLIRLESLRRESRQGAAEVGAVELRIFVDFAGEEASAERTVRHEADSEFLDRRYHFFLRRSRPQRVFALKCGEWLNRVCATDRLHASFGKAEVLHLPLLNQFFHRARDIFDRYVRIDTVLIKQIDRLDFEPLEGALDRFPDWLRLALQFSRSRSCIRAAQIESEFLGDHHFPAEWSERLAHKFFI